MPKRSSKKQPVEKGQAPAAAADAAAEVAPEPKADESATSGKNSAAVELGRLGGRKGGAARAKKLTKEQRSEIARKAAQTRWARAKDQ